MTDPSGPPAQRRRLLTVPKITFFVVAATAPLAAMVGTVPYGFALGTGAGMPAAYVLAGLTMVCFVAGYAAMSREIVNAGALYAYIRAALGRIPGSAAAYLAALSYNALTLGLFGAFGYFTDLILDIPGVSWHWYTAAAIALTAFLGRRHIDVSAKLLGILMAGEFAVLIVLDGGIAAHKGVASLPLASFDPKVALGTGLGAALAFAFTSFAGIESAALYGEEARDPRRTVALASYLAVAIVCVFYGLTSWLAVGGVGVGDIHRRSTSELGELFFNLTTQYTAEWVTAIMALLLLTSVLASIIALHNATSRYLFALGREGLLPRWLGATHPRFGSPYRASATQSVLALVVIAGFAAAGMDPYRNLGASMVSLGTVGIMVLLLATSLAVLVFFGRHATGRHWWRTIVAPGLALAGLAVAIVLVLRYYAYITGTSSVFVDDLPVLIPVAAAAGVARALWLRVRQPEAYHALGHTESAPGPTPAVDDAPSAVHS